MTMGSVIVLPTDTSTAYSLPVSHTGTITTQTLCNPLRVEVGHFHNT